MVVQLRVVVVLKMRKQVEVDEEDHDQMTPLAIAMHIGIESICDECLDIDTVNHLRSWNNNIWKGITLLAIIEEKVHS